MLWVTWRQHRTELIGVLAAAVVLAIITVFATAFAQRTRLELGVDTCVPLPSGNANCVDLSQEWRNRVGLLLYLFQGFYLVPALVASYIGGPLFARELERGTHRLAWTQGISRLRWAATTIGVVLAFTLAGAVVLAVVGGQTRSFLGTPLFSTAVYRPWDTFDVEGPAFVSFMLFGLAVGAFVGAWRRRILVGMFYGLLLFGLVRVGLGIELRPYYEPPIAVVQTPFVQTPVVFSGTFPPAFQSLVPSDAWQVGYDAVDSQGRFVSQTRVKQLNDEYGRVGCTVGRRCDNIAYLNEHDVYPRLLFQPADRYWRFQFTEAAIYTALTAGFVALTLVLLRRRDA
jgi:hypothetical protein